MKKLLILALALAPAVASAQETATVNVTTSVLGNFTLTPQALAFGNVQENTAIVIELDGTSENAGSTATRGQVALGGSVLASSQVRYSVAAGVGGSLSGANLTIPKTSGTGSDTPIVVALTYGRDTGSPVSYTLGTATSGSTVAEKSLVIGGSFTAAAGTAGNGYSAELIVTVIYD